METAKEVLESLHTQGLSEIELTESGMIVYTFYDILNLSEKDSAKGVLDE